MGCYNATLLNAAPGTVWSALRDFHDLSWSGNVVQEVTRVGDVPGTQVGAKRVLNGAFHETLLEVNEDSRSFKYSIDDGPGPVANGAVEGYVGEVRVLPITVPPTSDRCLVVWTSDWTAEQGGVYELCDPVYKAILTDMKAHFGQPRDVPGREKEAGALLGSRAELLFDHSLQTGHPRFFGYITSSPAPIAMLGGLPAAEATAAVSS